MILRDYQEAAVQSIFEYFSNGGKGNPIVAMPTGSGKSLIIGKFIQLALQQYPTTRVMKLTHVKELIEQNLEKLLAIWPNAPAGVFSSGLGRKDIGFPILFGGVASVAKSTPDLFGRIDLMLIDECHLLSPKETTMYQVIIKELKKVNPLMKVIGFTATPFRLGFGSLIDNNGLFTNICFDMTTMRAFNWLIDQGYLSPPIPKKTNLELDVSNVHIHGGEFKQDELQAAVDKEEVTYAALQEMIACGHDRQHWLIFASGIEHTIHVSAMLDSMGVSTTLVHSKMKLQERDSNILGFKQNKYRAMVNNGILTTGFDFPEIDLIGMLRPTQSTSLWVQALGRGTRPVYAKGYDISTQQGRLLAIAAGPKQNCLVLDFAGNTRRLGPINDPVLPKRKGSKGGTAPVRLCEACQTWNHASVRFCVQCGFEFPKHLKIKERAATDALLAIEEVITEIFKVDRVVYNIHYKDDRPPSLKVSYFCGLRMFKEYICLEHPGYASKRARDWWRERAENEPPETVMEALTKINELREPINLRVWLKKGSDEIMGYDYTGKGFS